MKNEKPKTIHYRKCEPIKNSETGFNLQKIVEDALKKVQKPYSKALIADNSMNHFLAYDNNTNGCLCGTLFLCEDRMIALADSEEDGSTFEGTIEPKDENGKKRKIQNNALFFAIRENHIAVIQTRSLSIKDLKDFFDWLVVHKAETKLESDYVFKNLPSKGALKKMKGKTIQSISLGKDLYSKIEPSENSGEQSLFTEFQADDSVLRLLKNWVKCAPIINKLYQGENLGNIYVSLNIRYRSRTHKDSQDVMHALASSVGDTPELDPTIHISKTVKIKGDELTIKDSIKVQCPGGNISPHDAMNKVAEWLISAIKAGKIC